MDSLFCSLCNVRCNAASQFKQHMNSKKHLKLVATKGKASKDISSDSKEEPLYCTLCKIYCSDLKLLRMHFTGLKHREKVRKLEPEEREKFEQHRLATWPISSQPSTLAPINRQTIEEKLPASLHVKALPVSLDAFLISALCLSITEVIEMYEGGRVTCPSLVEGLEHWKQVRLAVGNNVIQYNRVVDEVSLLSEQEFKTTVHLEFESLKAACTGFLCSDLFFLLLFISLYIYIYTYICTVF